MFLNGTIRTVLGAVQKCRDYDDEDELYWPPPFVHAERLRSKTPLTVVPYAGTNYQLVPISRFRNRVEVQANGKTLGTIVEKGLLRNNIYCDLPDTVPLPVRVFMCLVHSWWDGLLRDREMLDRRGN